MSDLISRSELLKRFCVTKDGHRIPERDCDNFEVTVSIKDVKTIIKEQPTAFDIEKVISKLNEKAENHGGEDYYIEIGDAIEIVKRGGVCGECIEAGNCDVREDCPNMPSNDVCEWEKGSSGYVGYPAYYSKCCTTNSKGLEMQTHIIADWKFCPYCGKKIKIVGD